ncbi:caspase-6-like isoform X2 [Trichomycterus rosablanca]|uniref:caspase-6-like isoform X2 n=1 Tax=Trichomycterus rosablanca TaxID=2290929 RepID=UPI002F354DD7
MAGATSNTEWPVEYKMDNKQRGYALIFNQEKFAKPKSAKQKSAKQRHGTNVDRDNLRERFTALGFRVSVHNDLKEERMMDELRKAALANHTDEDCFVCIILSHGKKDHISAFDKVIEINTITDQFRGDNCPSLVGKPKIFIIQACAGSKKDDPVTPMVGGAIHTGIKDPVLYTLPTGADFLMCYSVTEGFVSYRDPESGGLYIQELCKALEEHGSTLEFTELLTLVSMSVSRLEPLEKKQMPCFTSMLTKKLYFKPKHE